MENSLKKHKIAFFGTPRFAADLLEYLLKLNLEVVFVVAQPSAVSPSGSLMEPPVISTAKKHSLLYLQPTSLREENIESLMRKSAPETIIVAAYGKLIPKKLLDLPSFGWINVHASLLPRFRGASPIQAAILDGDSTSGVTLMKLNEGLDTGEIISQITIPVTQTETTPSLNEKIVTASKTLLKKSLIPYLEGKIASTPQARDGITLTKEIKKEDGRVIWSKTSTVIERMVRAYNPWPGVFFEFQNKRVTLHKVALGPSTNEHPGTCFFLEQKFYVACGEKTSLEVLMLQREGKKNLPIKEFLLGTPIKQGFQLT